MHKLSAINDFVVRLANVNGTGSASANTMFAKSIFRMGIPVSPKNIFPSNIQGLPTWYEVRISEKGYLGRREGVDLMVSVNPQSMMRDVNIVKPGGYFIYDSTKELRKEYHRDDIHFIGVPMMQLCMDHFPDPRQRQLLKNMVYIGALTALLNIEYDVVKGIIEEQFKAKERLINANMEALNMGIEYIHEHYEYPIGLQVERRDKTGDSIIIDGNTACGLGAVYAGATVAAWYPITPSTSLVQAFEKYAGKLRLDPETGKKNFAVVQMEDELAAIGVVLGAAWNGARSFTATSGPGVSLMSEFLGLAYFSEIPTVLIDVQRGGPSTGMPTRTQQSDLISAAYASHGDTRHVMLLPATPKECFDFTADAFDLAEQLQTPVLVMTDLEIGMNDTMSPPLSWDYNRKYNRGKVLSGEQLEAMTERFGRYKDVDGDGVPYRTIPGAHPTKGSYFTRGTSHDEYAGYTEDSAIYVKNVDRLMLKWETAKGLIPQPELFSKPGAEYGMIFFGTTTYPALEAMDLLNEEGISIEAMRLRAFPFQQEVSDFIEKHKKVFIVEQNRDAQMRALLINELEVHPKQLVKILNYDGFPITADFIKQEIWKHL